MGSLTGLSLGGALLCIPGGGAINHVKEKHREDSIKVRLFSAEQGFFIFFLNLGKPSAVGVGVQSPYKYQYNQLVSEFLCRSVSEKESMFF